jgi:beta-glucosidase
MVDVSRDARWGRVAEGSGEDVFLGSAIARARVRGFQGKSLKDSSSIASCVKHFAAYGAPIAGRDYNTVDVSEQQLFETYLPPYKAAIEEGAATVMSSFNELNGIPATGNSYLLKTILREQWKFKGFVVSDWGSVSEMIAHGYSKDGTQAALQAIEAGTDMDMMSNLFTTNLSELIQSGKLKMSVLDDAVLRVLSVKYDLGLFENPYKYSDRLREEKEIKSTENRQVARNMAVRSIVLLKNDKAILPLDKNIKSLAVIGPFADNKEDMNGTWSFFGEANDPVSILSGIQSKVAANTKVIYAKGCDVYNSTAKQYDDAIRAAKQAQVAIVVVGESAVMNGEGASRVDINIPDHQLELLKKIKSVNPNTIAVLINGRPLSLTWLDENLPAIVETWTLGTEAGNAIADIIFGDYNPSGKLPITFPRHLGQIPIYYDHKNTGRPYEGDHTEPPQERVYKSRYREVPNTPLYPFGYGLSYSNFSFKSLTLSKKNISFTDTLMVSIKVTNNGPYDGEEVIQLYLHDKVASITRPVKELKGFQKIFLKNGDSKTVEFLITVSNLSFYSAAKKMYLAEPGDFEIFVGNSSDNLAATEFALLD